MKRLICIIMTLCLLSSCFACAAKAEKETSKTELIVFAAASLTEAMNQIVELYGKVAPNVTISCNFDSSGTLKTQIEKGAPCDLFISAAPKQMNQLDITASLDINTDRLDFVLSETRINLLENKVTLIIPEGNPKNIRSFDDLVEHLKAGDILLAIGNGDVPVGQYTQKIFAFYNISEEEISSCLTYGSNVKEVTSQVSDKTVDCGIVYATDAYSANLEVVDTATKEMCGQVLYPAAVLKGSANSEAASAFLEYLKGPEASKVFSSIGFSPLSGN